MSQARTVEGKDFGLPSVPSPAFMPEMKAFLRGAKGRRGQTLVEYALILAFISVVAIAVLISLGQRVKSVFTTISSQLSTAQTSH
jgi:Flp pilus assembly pilin Flp